MPFSHEFLILLFLKNPDILFLLVRRVHIVNTCHIVHINYIICTGHIVHCLSYRHQPAELLKQIQKIQQKYLLLHSLCISFYTHFLFTPTVLHYALCVSVYIHIFLDFCMTLYTHFHYTSFYIVASTLFDCSFLVYIYSTHLNKNVYYIYYTTCICLP